MNEKLHFRFVLVLVTLTCHCIAPTASAEPPPQPETQPKHQQEDAALDLREHYYRANEDSDEADKFYERMESVPETSTSAREIGYKGIAALVQAKHSFNPLNKVTYFQEGRRLLEKGISMDPSSIELRFLRYTVQDNTPFFLDYHDKLEEDKQLLKNFLADEARAGQSPDLSERIELYFEEHEEEGEHEG